MFSYSNRFLSGIKGARKGSLFVFYDVPTVFTVCLLSAVEKVEVGQEEAAIRQLSSFWQCRHSQCEKQRVFLSKLVRQQEVYFIDVH